MSLAIYLYLTCTLICIIWNQRFYNKVLKKEGIKRISSLLVYGIATFFGPLSLILTIYCKIKTYIRRKKTEKILLKVIEDKLFKACEENGIKIVEE